MSFITWGPKSDSLAQSEQIMPLSASAKWCYSTETAIILVSVVSVVGICSSVGGGVFWHAITVPVMLTACHATVGGALNETVATVSLSTVPSKLSLLSRQSCRLRVGKWTRGGGRAVSPTGLPCVHAGSNDAAFRWLLLLCGIMRGSFQETAPRKTAENTMIAVPEIWHRTDRSM